MIGKIKLPGNLFRRWLPGKLILEQRNSRLPPIRSLQALLAQHWPLGPTISSLLIFSTGCDLTWM